LWILKTQSFYGDEVEFGGPTNVEHGKEPKTEMETPF